MTDMTDTEYFDRIRDIYRRAGDDPLYFLFLENLKVKQELCREHEWRPLDDIGMAWRSNMEARCKCRKCGLVRWFGPEDGYYPPRCNCG